MRLYRWSALFCLALSLTAASPADPKSERSGSKEPLVVEAKPIDSRLDDFKAALLRWVPELVREKRLLTRYRVLSFQDFPDGAFVAQVYDYSRDRNIQFSGKIPGPEAGQFWKHARSRWRYKMVDFGQDPLPPTPEEIQAAESLVRSSLGSDASLYDIITAMPGALPAEVIQASDSGLSAHERVITVGLRPREGSGKKEEIVGASLSTNRVVHFRFGAPPTAIANADDAQAAWDAGLKPGEPRVEFERSARRGGLCGVRSDTSERPDSGGGAATITIKQPTGEVLWTFDLYRPAASTGWNGSGIELRNVNYKGVRVLKRANVPIFNVQYDKNKCGPYRDWANEENQFQAKVKTILAGSRNSGIGLTSEMPQTVLQSGVDQGNYLGVAIYTDANQKTTLMSEMAAGWYRYLSMWVFHPDGSIEPMFGFAAVSAACVCNLHFHHTYWRLEFDLGGSPATPGVRVMNKFEKKVAGVWTASELQETFFRDKTMEYRVTGPSGQAYQIVPGAEDGSAAVSHVPGESYDRFAQSDVWVLNALDKDDQLDDHKLKRGKDDIKKAILISQWLKKNKDDPQNIKLDNKSVVVWYGVHFTHDSHNDAKPGATPEPHDRADAHILGPMLKPMQ